MTTPCDLNTLAEREVRGARVGRVRPVSSFTLKGCTRLRFTTCRSSPLNGVPPCSWTPPVFAKDLLVLLIAAVAGFTAGRVGLDCARTRAARRSVGWRVDSNCSRPPRPARRSAPRAGGAERTSGRPAPRHSNSRPAAGAAFSGGTSAWLGRQSAPRRPVIPPDRADPLAAPSPDIGAKATLVFTDRPRVRQPGSQAWVRPAGAWNARLRRHRERPV